jgi:hypothetical protein
MNVQHVVLIATAFLLLGGCHSQQPTYLAQPQPIQAEGSYTHAASGMVFPPEVGDFQRVSVTRYDTAELDVGVGYNLITWTSGVAATVYAYPAPSLVSIGSPANVVASARATLCNGEFERRKREVVHRHPGAHLIQEKDATLPQVGSASPGKMAAFDYDDHFGGRSQPLHSELYVFCYIGRKWALEYRFTHPKDFDAGEAISSFMAKLPSNVATASP